jgi:MGT family glycosyltransferase
MRTTAELLETELDAYRAERPDYVLTDSVAPWGQWVGELLGVPVVTSVSTFAFNRHVMRYGTSHGVRPQSTRQFLSKLRHIAKAVRLRARLQRQHGVRGPTLMGTISGHSALTLVYTSREFQPRAETFDDRYRFVGPLLGPRPGEQPFDWDRLPASTVVYVSLGTLFNADEAFYRQCFEAFTGAPYSIVLAVGGRIRLERLGAPPPNVRIFPHVPQLEVLGRASAFVTHGGMNSVSESLMSGVPMVVIPQMSEQAIVGRRAEELGAAVFLAKTDVTPARLRASVARLLEVSDFTQSAVAIGRSLREAGGVARAADEVLVFTRTQRSLAPAGAVAAGP